MYKEATCPSSLLPGLSRTNMSWIQHGIDVALSLHTGEVPLRMEEDLFQLTAGSSQATIGQPFLFPSGGGTMMWQAQTGDTEYMCLYH